MNASNVIERIIESSDATPVNNEMISLLQDQNLSLQEVVHRFQQDIQNIKKAQFSQ